MAIKRITVAVDFSAHARAAAELAMRLATGTGAEVSLLHVDPLPGAVAATPEPVYISPQMWESLRSHHAHEIEHRLAELENDMRGLAQDGVTISSALRRDPVADGIVGFARDAGADLILIGSQGASATQALIFGTTTGRVIRRATCPVLVTAARDEEEETAGPGRPPLSHALVGIDYSRFSAACAHAGEELLAPDGVLELVHVWSAPYLHSMEYIVGDARRHEMSEVLESYRHAEVERLNHFITGLDLALPPERTRAYIEVGSPARGILQRAEDTHADLIVVGAHSRDTVAEKLLGTVADQVVRAARVPVLLIPRGQIDQR